MNKKLVVKCPVCKTLVEKGAESFPFCSDRCQTIDLGNWASDAYAIKGEALSDEDVFDMQNEQQNQSIH